MFTLLTHLGEGFAALIFSALATWYKLRAARYRTRWLEALRLKDDEFTPAGKWEAQLKMKRSTYGDESTWIVTNGRQRYTVGKANLDYTSLREDSKKHAENFAKELNSGGIKVAA